MLSIDPLLTPLDPLLSATGEIRGVVWEDVNGDGIRDADESVRTDVTIFLDLDRNGALDQGEPSVQSDATGQYVFTGLEPGTYAVCEVLPDGWKPSYPTPALKSVRLVSDIDDLVGSSDHDVWGSISPDGRYVLLNVIEHATWSSSIYLQDLASGTTELLSINSADAPANISSHSPSISADGRYIAFVARVAKFVSGYTEYTNNLYLQDRSTGKTSCVVGDVLGNSYIGSVTISSDGRSIAFESAATDLVPGIECLNDSVYVYDRQTDTIRCASCNAAGTTGNFPSSETSFSADGRFVAFCTNSTNLVPNNTDETFDILVYDMLGGILECVSVLADGTPLHACGPSISGDGRYVVFEADVAKILDPDSTAVHYGICLYDRQTHTIRPISINADGELANSGARAPRISANGRFVAYVSEATNLTPETASQNDHTPDIFVYDLQTGTTRCASLGVNKYCGYISISDDGRSVTFGTDPFHLSAGDYFDAYLAEFGNPGSHSVEVQPGTTADGVDFGNARLPFEVVTSSPGGVQVLSASPECVTMDFTDDIDPATLEADDLLVGSLHPTAAVLVDSNTVEFALPAIGEGVYGIELRAGSILSNIGSPVQAFATQFTVDTTAPVVTVTPLTTLDTTPAISGTIDDPQATVEVTIGDTTYVAANRGDGTWTLADGKIAPALARDTYDVRVAATDRAGNTGIDSTVNELIVDDASAVIRGVKWEDLDGDGVRDNGEPGIAGATIYLDLNQNGQFDQGELSTLTDPDGRYAFEQLPLGSYHVADLFQEGWHSTYPTFARQSLERVNSINGWTGSRDFRGMVSPDGSCLLLVVTNGQTNQTELYLRDPVSGSTSQIKSDSPGWRIRTSPDLFAVSADGQYVTYVVNETIYLLDRQPHSIDQYMLVGVGSQETLGGLAMSADGRYVAFRSNGRNLTPGVQFPNNCDNVFVLDRQTHTLRCASRNAAGIAADSNCGGVSLSADGRFVCFNSFCANLVPDDTNHTGDVFVYDVLNDTLERARIGAGSAHFDDYWHDASISGNGRYLAAVSSGDRSGISVYDRVTGDSRLVSLNADGEPADEDCWSPKISLDGRFVAYISWAKNLTPETAGDVRSVSRVFVCDLQTGTTRCASLNPDGSLPGVDSSAPSISADGRYAVYVTSNRHTSYYSPLYDVCLAEFAAVGSGDMDLNESTLAENVDFGARRQSFVVTASNMDDGALLGDIPIVTIDFNCSVDPKSLQADDLVIGSLRSAAAVSLDGDTVQFTLPALDDGSYIIELPPGALSSTAGTPLKPFSVSFALDRVAPIASDDYYETGTSWAFSAAKGVLANDIDGQPDLSAYLLQGPAHGYLSLSYDGSFCYSPQRDFRGIDTFTYVASDGLHKSNPATVTLRVTHELGAIDFRYMIVEIPACGRSSYRFSATHDALLSVEAIGTDLQIVLEEDPLNGAAICTASSDHPRAELAATAGQAFYVELNGTPGSVELRLANLVEQNGSTLTVHGTTRSDQFTFDASAGPRFSINGMQYTLAEEADRVLFDGGPGRNTATLYGTAGDETVRLQPGGGTLAGDGFEVSVSHTSTILAYGSGGRDVAYLDDSEGNDQFDAWPDAARLLGTGFYNRVKDFETVLASSTAGGQDAAYLRDSRDDDTFEAWPESARLYGQGFDNTAAGFAQVYGTAENGGKDVAYLHGSEAVDTFVATPTTAKLSGATYQNQADHFDFVHAFATPDGGDVARLYDSKADDQFDAWPEVARLFGPGFYNRALAFDFVHAFSTAGGHDVANFHDSPRSDVFKATPDYARMYGMGFNNRAKGFEEVHAWSSPGALDRAELSDSKYKDLLYADANSVRLSSGSPHVHYWIRLFDFPSVKAKSLSASDRDGAHVRDARDYLILEGSW